MPYGQAMAHAPTLTLHVLGPSHPCRTAEAARHRKELEYERVELAPGPHNEVVPVRG
jgi:glutathione S-transferase